MQGTCKKIGNPQSNAKPTQTPIIFSENKKNLISPSLRSPIILFPKYKFQEQRLATKKKKKKKKMGTPKVPRNTLICSKNKKIKNLISPFL